MTKHSTRGKSSGGNTTKGVEGDHGREEWYTTDGTDSMTREEGSRSVNGSRGAHHRARGCEKSAGGFGRHEWS